MIAPAFSTLSSRGKEGKTVHVIYSTKFSKRNIVDAQLNEYRCQHLSEDFGRCDCLKLAVGMVACRIPQYTSTFLACSAATSQLHLKALFLLTDNAAVDTSHLSALKKFVQMSEMVRLRFAMEKLPTAEEAPHSDWMDDTWTSAGLWSE